MRLKRVLAKAKTPGETKGRTRKNFEDILVCRLGNT